MGSAYAVSLLKPLNKKKYFTQNKMRSVLQRFTCFPLQYYVQFAFIIENCSPTTKCVTKTGNVGVQMRISMLGVFHTIGQTTSRLYTIYKSKLPKIHNLRGFKLVTP
jgi:hypothetical protein